jgi:plasmid stabilization system protein ParE
MPGRKVTFHPDDEVDGEIARQWYAERNSLVARAFLTELAAAVEHVSQFPDMAPGYLAGTRRYLLPHFPFSLVYRVSGDVVTIVAVTHHRRKPGHWTDRS